MNTTREQLPQSPSQDLAQAALVHLQLEENHLQATLESLNQLRAALIQGNTAALTQTIANRTERTQAEEEMLARRLELQQDIARSLGISHAAATLQRLAESTGGETGERLKHVRERLRSLAAQVDDVTRLNGYLINHSLSFVQHLLTEITGGDTSKRYGPAGIRPEAGCGNLLIARG